MPQKGTRTFRLTRKLIRRPPQEGYTSDAKTGKNRAPAKTDREETVAAIEGFLNENVDARPVQAADDPLGALMQAAQSGDRGAYRSLLERLTLRLRLLIRRRAPWLDRDEIEDLVQETLISVHLARASYDPARPFLPWLATIARCRIADAARAYGRRAALDVAMSESVETFCSAATNNHAENVVNFLAVRRALGTLSPAERDALSMLRLRQLTLSEASEESGTSVAALKVAVHRAGKRLRGVLEGENPDEAHR
ncbi:MAG: RNA polymerase [Alphaproteobacteria bacterium HGW-Alphaproteobacteria-2]|nr:MAG: RNA polymerase [Alphaproteobacteria bacterium HGW-Alphaproteobacteria-2]